MLLNCVYCSVTWLCMFFIFTWTLKLFILLCDLEQVVQIYFQSLQTRAEVSLAIKILSDNKDWFQTIYITGVLYSKMNKEINFQTVYTWERFFFLVPTFLEVWNQIIPCWAYIASKRYRYYCFFYLFPLTIQPLINILNSMQSTVEASSVKYLIFPVTVTGMKNAKEFKLPLLISILFRLHLKMELMVLLIDTATE